MACVATHIEVFKKQLAWATDKHLQVISNIMLFKAVIPLRDKIIKSFNLSNYIVCVAMWCLVMYSNCLVVYYQLILHGSTIRYFYVLFCLIRYHYTINNDYNYVILYLQHMVF